MKYPTKKTNGALQSVDLLIVVCDCVLRFFGLVSEWAVRLITHLVRRIGTYYWGHKVRFCTDVVTAILFVAVTMTGSLGHRAGAEVQINEQLVDHIDQYTLVKRDVVRERAVTNSREFMKVGGPEWIRKVSIQAVIDAAREAGLDSVQTSLLLGIVNVESSFNPYAKAKGTAACGINQFIPETGKRFGLATKNCFDPNANARAQVRHFKMILRKESVRNVLRTRMNREQFINLFREVYCLHHDGLNAKSCEPVVDEMTTKATPMLFGAYSALHTAQQHTAEVSFFHAVYRTLERMRTHALSQISNLSALVR